MLSPWGKRDILSPWGKRGMQSPGGKRGMLSPWGKRGRDIRKILYTARKVIVDIGRETVLKRAYVYNIFID